MRTFTYKTVGELKIDADVFIPESNAPLATIVFFHGGGLLCMDKAAVAPHMKRAVNDFNMLVVSLDYRLAPQASLPMIVEDVHDGITWAQHTLPSLLNLSVKLDPAKVFVCGASAGGYLAVLAGLSLARVDPVPKAILAIYPITNPLGPFFTTPQRPVSYNDGKIISHESMAKFVDAKGPVVNGSSDDQRKSIYTYMIQEANLAQLLFVNAPDANIDDYIPQKQVTSAYPPTYMIHGDIDDKVGIEQATSLAAAMKAQGVELQFDEIKGAAQHGFDYAPEEQMDNMYSFLKARL